MVLQSGVYVMSQCQMMLRTKFEPAPRNRLVSISDPASRGAFCGCHAQLLIADDGLCFFFECSVYLKIDVGHCSANTFRPESEFFPQSETFLTTGVPHHGHSQFYLL
jgi:hypothetical protein